MKLSAKTQIAAIIAFTAVSISNSAFADREQDIARLSRQCGTVVARDGVGTRVYTVAEGVRTQLTGGSQDFCNYTDQDVAAYCRNWGNESFEIQQRCYHFQNTHPAIESMPGGQQQVCPQNLLGRNGETASDLRQNINAFYGDEASTESGLRQRYFTNCPALPTGDADFLANDLSFPGDAGCASMVTLQCGSRTLTGFHLVRRPGNPANYRVYTAAHVVNYYNRQILGTGGSGIYDFQNCQIRFANGGPTLNGSTISAPQFRTTEVRDAVTNRQTSSFSATPALRQNDIAWFNISPNGNERILTKASLVPYSGTSTALSSAVICTAGHFGTGSTVQACQAHGARVASDGRLGTRTATVRGMSGGALVSYVGGRSYAAGVISSEWNATAATDVVGEQLPGTGGSQVLEYNATRDNWAVRQ